MKFDCIDYRHLPGQNPLFLAFLYEFEKVRSFYQPVPESRDAFNVIIKHDNPVGCIFIKWVNFKGIPPNTERTRT